MENKGKYPIGGKGKNFRWRNKLNGEKIKKPHRGEKEKKEIKGNEGIEKTSMGKNV